MPDQVPLKWRYVNQGPDKRVGGPVGKLLGGMQRAGMHYSTKDPKVASAPIGSGHIAVAWPPFFSLFVPRKDGKYFSLRFGWRRDVNVGDGNNPNEPAHDPPGAYFPDVILKPKIDHVVDPKG